MLGHRPHWYLKLMWALVSPLLLLCLFIFYIINYIQGGAPTYQAWDKHMVNSTKLLHKQTNYTITGEIRHLYI